MMICYRVCISSLEKFDGSEEKKVQQSLTNIERIGRMINDPSWQVFEQLKDREQKPDDIMDGK